MMKCCWWVKYNEAWELIIGFNPSAAFHHQLRICVLLFVYFSLIQLQVYYIVMVLVHPHWFLFAFPSKIFIFFIVSFILAHFSTLQCLQLSYLSFYIYFLISSSSLLVYSYNIYITMTPVQTSFLNSRPIHLTPYLIWPLGYLTVFTNTPFAKHVDFSRPTNGS